MTFGFLSYLHVGRLQTQWLVAVYDRVSSEKLKTKQTTIMLFNMATNHGSDRKPMTLTINA